MVKFYKIVRPIARVALRIFYKKIHVSHRERIPLDKPVLLAANHPTAFLDPCLLACFQPRELHFMVRGDMFRKPFYASLLRSLNMIPIFRLKDGGYEKVKSNLDIFDECYRTLSENKVIMILAEGSCVHEKRLRPIRKGTARMAFGALEQYPDLDIHILPVGVNYTYAARFRGSVMIDVGEPIRVQEFRADFEKNKNRGIKQVTERLAPAMKQRVVHIADPDDDLLVEHLLQLYRAKYDLHYPIIETVTDQTQPLRTEKSVADYVNGLDDAPKSLLRHRLQTLFERLGKYSVIPRNLFQSRDGAWYVPIYLILFAPFAVLGLIFNAPPALAARHIARTKVRTIEFYTSVMLGAALGIFLIYYLLALVLGMILLPAGAVLLGLLLLFLWGWDGLKWYDRGKRYVAARRFGRIDSIIQEELRREAALLMQASDAVDVPNETQ